MEYPRQQCNVPLRGISGPATDAALAHQVQTVFTMDGKVNGMQHWHDSQHGAMIILVIHLR